MMPTAEQKYNDAVRFLCVFVRLYAGRTGMMDGAIRKKEKKQKKRRRVK
jgi:DNA-directed RNA polymerase beta' subunit